MEIVRCDVHGEVCLLKTGLKEGPNQGKSFYLCRSRRSPACGFTLHTDIPPSHCLLHEDSIVELQTLIQNDQQKYRLYFRCAAGKTEGQKWCGNIPWNAVEKKSALTEKKEQPSTSAFPAVRNPFKAAAKTEISQWRRLNVAERREEGADQENRKSLNKEEEKESRGEVPNSHCTEKENHSQGNKVELWRNKAVPPGMKIKKRLSDDKDQKTCSAAASEEQERVCDDNAEDAGKDSAAVGRRKENVEEPCPTSGDAEKPQCQRRATGASDSDDDVLVVAVQPACRPSPSVPVQKSLTCYPGFQPASQFRRKQEDPWVLHSQLSAQLKQKKATLSMVDVSALPDKGDRLKAQVKELEEALEGLSLAHVAEPEKKDKNTDSPEDKMIFPSAPNPFSRPGGTKLLAAAPAPHQQSASSSSMGLHLGCTQMCGGSTEREAFYGGRMTESRLLAVRNATTEAIDHLHNSLESCPDTESEARDPTGIKVKLLPHQRRALAWLLWRETQKPCGGILADDMGLGKTLNMIALILAQKKNKDEKDTKLEGWISKDDMSMVQSQGTLVVCPASLVHHWKKEIERHVKDSHLSVYLYHGPNRLRNARTLAEHDVVVTTYSLVSKEIPVEKEDCERPHQEEVTKDTGPLLRVAWSRVILDEAHNIKNPKVQTSVAVCKLRAAARWAVTGTPIQNNLLDMYSLIRFLRCSPFDEYKLWKAQVDNGSKRGGERLNILTRTLLLRRTKDQMDSTGKPLVALPDRKCVVHRIKLSEDEQSIYDVVFAQSRSTLQSYLKRHEGGDLQKASSGNPFDQVAREFGVSQQGRASPTEPPQASSAVHILSLLLRLRQCCCHPSLLRKTLDQSEMQGDGITLTLEEQLNALSLSEASGPKTTVTLNGSRFSSKLFEETWESTKILAILNELKEIRNNQKSVIVSQWTSMLNTVAVHLKRLDLSFAVIDGTVNPKRRMDLVEEFNTNPKQPQVMLVSLCAGGVGINLIGGNHLFLIDMHWNPALEDQACDRIYRVGQKHNVIIHRFVCEQTVEDKISSLQEKKKELAQKVLTGTGTSFTKLTLADLRIIFGV
ncbi:transcription termination factor 2 isoform X2 [Denticeps clupeoides]|uniref:Transcription termination factor 2 n=1 Tax=Denticeps clupeoides TaxID=299321 RepID=A0AAY4C4J5_9TELE|nr:transcription termination factor 2 isoform X2 [Denticeps clupeoides]